MKNVLKKIGRVLLVILIILAVFFLGVFIFHRVMLSKEKPLIAEPLGTMVEVDGGEMCVYTEAEGEHTIVFMSGYGTPSPILDFKPLYSRLSDDFRIVVVEKFGYGFSDETDMSRDVDTMLEQTRKAIAGAGIEGEFILCPHSASGIEAIYWAQKYPDEIEGIAFLDVAMPGYHEEAGYSIFLDELMQIVMNSGVGRLLPDETHPYSYNTDELTDEEKAQFKALLFARRGSETMIHEAEWCKENMETISGNAVPDVPMLFFTSKQMAAVMFPSDPEKYLTLAERYTGREVENILLECGHCVHVEEPDFIAEKIRGFTETLPCTFSVNESAGLAEQVADVLYYLAGADGNELHDGYYSSISLADVNFDGVPEIKLYDSAGSAANFVYLYSLDGSPLGSYGIPSMDTSYECVEKDGRKYFMLTGKCLDFHPQNGEEGPADYHIVSIMDFESGEEYNYRATIIYEDDTLEKILSATVRTDDIEIKDTATLDEIEGYYNEFMTGFSVIGSVDSVLLKLNRDDLSSKEVILEKITAEVQEFEALGKE